jgi:MFS family permease
MESKVKLKFDYTWVIIALCFLSVMVGLGFCSSGRTYYLTAITEALNIPRGAFSLNDTFRYVTTTIVNIFFGSLIAKFGSKKLILAGFACLICFTVINSVAESLYMFYIGGIFLGLGIAWTGTTMVSAILNKWCTKNKGTITGAVLAANGLGGAISVQILTPIIFQEGNKFGYRDSYHLVTLILLITFIIIAVFYKDKRTEGDNDPKTYAKKRKARGEGWIGMDYSEGIKKPYLYVGMFCMFLTGMVLQGLNGIAVPYMYDLKFDIGFVATLSSIGSIVMIFTKFLTGFMYDRFGMRLTMNIEISCAFISMFCLIFLTNSAFGRVLAAMRIIIGNVALPLETVMLPLFASEFFGNKSFDKFVGLFASASTAGFAVGAPFGNVCYDIFGSYKVAFAVFTVLMAIVAVGMQYVLTAANRDRKIILKREEEKKKEAILAE